MKSSHIYIKNKNKRFKKEYINSIEIVKISKSACKFVSVYVLENLVIGEKVHSVGEVQ